MSREHPTPYSGEAIDDAVARLERYKRFVMFLSAMHNGDRAD